jgi:hypothetical protein
MRTLARAHGLGKGLTVKADLYTCIGLDSKVYRFVLLNWRRPKADRSPRMI